MPQGSVKRDNGNIGTLTTQSVTWVGSYGVTDRLSVMAILPYVWTHASRGPLHGMHGLQDFTLAAKYQLLTTPLTDRGTLRAFRPTKDGSSTVRPPTRGARR